MDPTGDQGGPVLIPVEALQRDTLIELIEEFVTREGTDYGHQENALISKVHSIEKQLISGEAVIVYDPIHQNTNIVSRDAAEKFC